jgi:Mrp family chromosome partitioning ATPase
MSKNFELLRQAGWRQELFEGLPTEAPPPEAPVKPTASRRVKRFPLGDDQVSTLVQRIFLHSGGSDVRTVMFSGVVRRVGCTRTCAQAAKTLANAVAGTVCVVDANFEAPSLDHHISPSTGPGLSDAILESKPGRDYAECIADSNLWMLVAGRQATRVNGFSKGATLESYVRELAGQFDYLLVDGPSLSSGSLAFSVGRAGDGAVLVLEPAGVAPHLLLKARKQLEAARVPLFGVVLNQREPALPPLLDRLMK